MRSDDEASSGGSGGWLDRGRGRALYFAVQLALGGWMYYVGDQGQATPLVWLVLLPPVAHSVILLPRPGIGLVSVASIGILLGNVVRLTCIVVAAEAFGQTAGQFVHDWFGFLTFALALVVLFTVGHWLREPEPPRPEPVPQSA